MEKGATIKHDISKSPNTGSWRNERPVINDEKCIGCGMCVKFCPEACIKLKSRGEGALKLAEIDYDFSKGCGVCAQVCPVKAIDMKRE